MAGLRGFIVRCGLTVLPLGMVILLCCLMMGWPGRAQSQAQVLPAPPALSAQAAIVPSQDDVTAQDQVPLRTQHQKTPQAAFERLHITHARINVPN